MKQATFDAGRVSALSDGKFAIAMTLLVLELKLPDLAPGLGALVWVAFPAVAALGAAGSVCPRDGRPMKKTLGFLIASRMTALTAPRDRMVILGARKAGSHSTC